MVNDALCFTFDPTGDEIIENSEFFTFTPNAENELDVFADILYDSFFITINDDDGKKIHRIRKVRICHILYLRVRLTSLLYYIMRPYTRLSCSRS